MKCKENISIEYLNGFYEEELDDFYSFRWMDKDSKIKINSKGIKGKFYFQFNCFSNFRDLSQVLKIYKNKDLIFEAKLLHQWHILTFELEFLEDEILLDFEANKLFPKFYYPNDSRNLAIRLADFKVHQEERKFKNVKDSYENAVKNIEEMSRGEVVLTSFPQNLGIDLYEKCNIKPPCVYCLWDESKIMEGSSEEIKVNDETFISYGDFYFKTRKLINCSIGESFINHTIEKILDLFDRDEKILEISTNGHSFSERILKTIEGKKVIIYISLDAATSATYSKLRNDQFERFYENLKKLKNAKINNWSKIYLVFMPMKVNLKDLEIFFLLGKEISADYIILRPLNYIKEKRKPFERDGYKFYYNKKILNYNEQLMVWEEALNLSEKYQMPVLNQLFFGIEEKRNKIEEIPEEANLCSTPCPICKEPWENYYILRRGILPCCYGDIPLASMDQFKEKWNSKEIVEIKKYLKDGKLSPYCLKSPSCPIVKRYRLKKSNFLSKIFKK